MVRAAQDFDAFYRDRLREAEQTDHLLVLSFDGKGIAMRLADLREATRKKAEADRANRTRTRLASGEKPNAKRMAEVATVYTLAQWPRTLEDVLHGLRDKETEARRPRPTSKRVWASIAHSPQGVINDAFNEAVRRDPDMHRRWVVLVDGHRDQIRYIKRAAGKVGANLLRLLPDHDGRGAPADLLSLAHRHHDRRPLRPPDLRRPHPFRAGAHREMPPLTTPDSASLRDTACDMAGAVYDD